MNEVLQIFQKKVCTSALEFEAPVLVPVELPEVVLSVVGRVDEQTGNGVEVSPLDAAEVLGTGGGTVGVCAVVLLGTALVGRDPFGYQPIQSNLSKTASASQDTLDTMTTIKSFSLMLYSLNTVSSLRIFPAWINFC